MLFFIFLFISRYFSVLDTCSGLSWLSVGFSRAYRFLAYHGSEHWMWNRGETKGWAGYLCFVMGHLIWDATFSIKCL